MHRLSQQGAGRGPPDDTAQNPAQPAVHVQLGMQHIHLHRSLFRSAHHPYTPHAPASWSTHSGVTAGSALQAISSGE